nr:hypothetical protein Ade03nite_01670 [Actinoplanes derwentensis]
MGRHARRLAVFLVLTLVASMGIPSGLKGDLPLGWLDFRLSWTQAAAAYVSLPVQKQGPGADGHYGGKKAGFTQPEPVKRKPWTADEAVGADSFDPADSKKVTGRSSSTTDVFENPDGSQTAKVSTGRVNYRGADGKWRPIDTSLSRGTDGRLKTKANSFGVSLAAPQAKSAARQAAEDLARITLPTGEVFAYRLQDALAVTPAVDGDKSTYAEILPGVDVRLQTLTNSVKETIVLKSPAATREFVFPLELTGLTADLTADGGLALRDAANEVVLTVPRPFMEDSSPLDGTGSRPKSYAIGYSLIDVDGTPALKVTADDAWIDDPKRVWPIEIDPTVYTAKTMNEGDVYVDNDTTTGADEQNGSSIAVGRYENVIARSYMKFQDFDTDGFVGKRITGAKLWAYLTYAYTCDVYSNIYVRKVTTPWLVGDLDTAALAAGPSVTAPIGTLKITDHTPGCTNTVKDRSVGQWHAVTLDPTTLHDWATNRGSANWDQGLAITGDEVATNSWKRFTSGNYSDAYKAYLEVTYANNVAPQVNTLFPPSGTQSPSLTPQLIADGYDPDGFPATLEYNFEVFQESATGTQTKIKESGWRTDKTWTVPAGTLKWGGRYRWQVTLNDGRNNEGVASYTWSPSWRFLLTTPVPQSPLTASLEQHGDAGFAPGSGTYTSSAVDAQVSSVGPALEIARTYNSVDTRLSGAFGAGWSSLVDAKVTERKDATGALTVAEVTYPTGQTVAYGRNADGTWSAGLGRYAKFAAVTGGYQLTDKSGVGYLFTSATGTTGVYGLTSVTDTNGRPLNLTWTGGKVTQVTSAASKRNLFLTWSGAHVASVVTDPAVAGDAATAATWSYTYSGDQLAKVCPPTSATACTQYTYTDGNLYPTTVENLDAYSYWRLGEASGVAQAASAATERMKADYGTHTNVTLGTAGSGALPGSTATAATYNGTTSRTALPAKTVSQAGYQSVSMWFKTSAAGDHVLYSQSWDPITTASTANPYQPVLYVGTNGQLYGSFPTLPAAGTTLGSFLGSASGRCLDAENDGLSNGSNVILQDCTGAGKQIWKLTAAGQLHQNGLATRCMREEGTEAGSGVDVQDCSATAANQKWRLTGDGRIVSQESGMCVNPYGNGTVNGTVMTIWPCGRPYTAVQTFSTQNHSTLASATAVNDGNWHHAVLSAAGDRQTLYVDGVAKATQTGVVVTDIQPRYQYLGAGHLGGTWTAQDNAVAYKNNGSPDYYSGALSDVAVFDQPLTADRVTELYGARASRKLLSQITRPSGAVTAKVAYDPVSGRVRKVTDGDNGSWTLADPQVKGSSQVYASAVLGDNPVDYWRLNDLPGTTEPYNEVNGNTATYSSVTLGGTPGTDGPFKDTTAPLFSGVAGSEITGDTASVSTAQSFSVSTWLNAADLTVNRAAVAITGAAQSTAFMLSYDKATNKWAAVMCSADVTGSTCPRTASTSTPVANTWTHLAATFDAPTKTMRLYVNGVLEKTAVLTHTLWAGSTLVAGHCFHNAVNCDLWKGRVAEIATYQARLTDAEILAQFNSADRSATGVAMPAKSIAVTGPTAKNSTQLFNLYTGQQIADTDTLGNLTQFGYDGTTGAMTLKVDPNGNKTELAYDVRGNVLSQTTWPDQTDTATRSTTRFTYFPDATSTNPAPDPRNDKILTVQDGRTDGTYRTTYTYDTRGNTTAVTDPLGRVTTTVHSDGTTGAPAGLATRQVSPGGSVTTTEFAANGDITAVTDPAGKITRLTYDQLGRVLTSTEVSKTNPNGLTSGYTYDKLGRILTLTQPGVLNRVTGATHTAVTTYQYNVDGQSTAISVTDTTGGDTARQTTTEYNTLGQVKRETEPDGTATAYTYDLFGEVLTATDDAGTTVATEYDSEGQILSVRFKNYTGDPDDPKAAADVVTESRAYDPGGRLIRSTDAEGWSTEYAYTSNNLLKTATQIGATAATRFVLEDNTYDLAGNLLKQVTNDGRTTTAYTIDAAARPYQVTVDPTGVNRKVTNVLSPDDLVLASTVRDSAGTVVAQNETIYDPAGNDLVNTTFSGSTNGPAGRWKLGETTGTVGADTAGNTPAEFPSWAATQWSTDKPASRTDLTGSVQMTEADTYEQLTTPVPVVDAARSYSVSAWVKLKNPTQNHAAVSQESGQSSAFVLGYTHDSKSWWMAVCDNGGVNCTSAESTQTAATDAWTHLTGVYDAAAKTVKLYVNGTLQNTVAWCCAANTVNGTFAIGGSKWDGWLTAEWAGNLADVQAYQRVLSDADVTAVYDGSSTWAGAKLIRESFERDTDGTITSELDPNGERTYYQYDEAGRMALTIDPPTTTERYDSAPVTTRSISYAGYNTFGELTEERDPTGNTTTTRYDAGGRPVKTIYPSYTAKGSATALWPEETTQYDAVTGEVSKVIDAAGNETSLTYDALGRVTKVTNADGGLVRYTYDRLGNVLSVTDPTGAKQTSTYDYLGRTETETQIVRQTGAAHTSTYTYGPGGWLSQATSPDKATEKYTYNALGETLTSTDSANATTTYQYGGAGDLLRTTLADNTYQTTTYDLASRPTAAQSYDAAGTLLTSTGVTYDRASNVVAATDARGATTKFTYDAAGLLTAQDEPVVAGTTSIGTSFGYDAAGRPTRFTDGRGNAFWTTYNTWGLPESTIEPATTAHPAEADRTFTTVYDLAGLPVRQIQPGGVEVVNTYDEMGQVTRSSGSGAEAQTTDREYAYDLAGRVTELSGPGGDNTLAWDDRSLLTSVTGPSGNSSFTYTGDGQTKTRVDAAGTTTYGYDPAGRLSTIANPSTGIQETVGYDALSQVTKVTYGTNGNTRNLGYDSLHRLTTDELKTTAGASVARISYGYDQNSNLTSKTTTGFAGATANSYTYDLANRLTSWNNGTTTVGYEYDRSGNRTRAGTKTFTYDDRNRLLTSSQGDSYEYTARGTLRRTLSGTVGYETTADAFGQIIRQQSGDNTFENYQYDGLGRVVKTGFAYTGLENDLATDGTSTYTRDPGGGLLGVQGLYAWTDRHTDLVAQFTATGASLSGSTTYDPLGNVVTRAGVIGNLGFQQEYTEQSTGRVNMHARWYNPETGQFDTRDTAGLSPVGNSGNANRYGYGNANPLSNIDPTGHWSMSISGCNTTWTCLVQGFVNSFDVIGMASSVIDAFGDLSGTINRFIGGMVTDANNWKTTISNVIHDKFDCGAWWVPMRESTCNNIVSKVATVGGWACALSGVCQIIYDCLNYNSGGKNGCAEAVGGLLADAVKALVTVGAGAVVSRVANRITSLLKRFGLPDRRKKSSSGSGNSGTKKPKKASKPKSEKKKTKAKTKKKSSNSTKKSTKKKKSSNSTKKTKSKKKNTKAKTKTPKKTTTKPKGTGKTPVKSTPVKETAPEPRLELPTARVLDGNDIGYDNRTDYGTCPGHSFDPVTRVLMADGTTKPIAEVELGDEVKTTDPETGETTSQPVTVLHHNLDTELADVTVSDTPSNVTAETGEGKGGRSTRGPTVLKTTGNHPFWDDTAKQWVGAGDLEPGKSTLLTADGATVHVTAVRTFTGAKRMLDLTVDVIHTYYVLAGTEPVLVHNCLTQDSYDFGGQVRYGALDKYDRPTGVWATVTKDMLHKGQSPGGLKIEGLPKGMGTLLNLARGHLLADRLGGKRNKKNLVALTQDPVNSPIMRDGIEQTVYDAVDGGQVVQYSIEPVYVGKSDTPRALRISAYGNGPNPLVVKEFELNNPAGMFGFGDEDW